MLTDKCMAIARKHGCVALYPMAMLLALITFVASAMAEVVVEPHEQGRLLSIRAVDTTVAEFMDALHEQLSVETHYPAFIRKEKLNADIHSMPVRKAIVRVLRGYNVAIVAGDHGQVASISLFRTGEKADDVMLSSSGPTSPNGDPAVSKTIKAKSSVASLPVTPVVSSRYSNAGRREQRRKQMMRKLERRAVHARSGRRGEHEIQRLQGRGISQGLSEQDMAKVIANTRSDQAAGKR